MFKYISITVLLLALSVKFGIGLECYNCYTDVTSSFFSSFRPRDANVVPCDEDLTQSNTWVCPAQDAVCAYIHYKLANQVTVLRTCSAASSDICKNGLPTGVEILDCFTCATDKCNNLDEPPPSNNGTSCPTLTLDVNLNINLNVRQIN